MGSLFLQALHRNTCFISGLIIAGLKTVRQQEGEPGQAERGGINHSQPYAVKTSAQGTPRDAMSRTTMNGKFRF